MALALESAAHTPTLPPSLTTLPPCPPRCSALPCSPQIMFVLVVLSLTLCFIALMYLLFEKDESFKEALSFTIVLLVRGATRRRKWACWLLLAVACWCRRMALGWGAHSVAAAGALPRPFSGWPGRFSLCPNLPNTRPTCPPPHPPCAGCLHPHCH